MRALMYARTMTARSQEVDELRTSFALRIPIWVREKITERATHERKSLNAVVVEILEDAFEVEREPA